MTDTARPAPLVPAEVDLRDFGFMPLHVQRLRDSDLAALATGDEFKAAVLLWCFAWHQVPAASLPTDDKILAARSGANEKWRRVKARALAGFVECSDGRLYHPVIAEAALQAWERRDAFQTTKVNRETRQQRWRAECTRLASLLRDAGVTPPAKPTKAQLVSLCRLHVDGFVDADVDAGETHVDDGEMRKRGRETEREIQERAHSTAAARAPEPDTQGHAPTPSGLVCRAMKAKGLAAVNPGDPRLLALLEQGATLPEFEGLAEEAVTKAKGFAWVLVTLAARRQDAQQIALAPSAEQREAARPWHETPAGIKAKGAELGMPWSEDGWVNGEHMAFPTYSARVKQAAHKAERTAA